MFGLVYDFDVRIDSARMLTAKPVQPCQNQSGNIQLCKMQSGVYTLVVQGLASMNCTAVTPAFYVDNVGFSRFDHAFNAYDFGPLVPDGNFYLGKPGDTNPLHPGRAPSNDFFYCTTGAQERDPSNAVCYTVLSPEINSPNNNVALLPDFNRQVNFWETLRRNLWYTFVANHPGTITIRVDNKTAGKDLTYRFAVYRSDKDGTLDFSTLKAQGKVDSTLAQGLTFVANNATGWWCTANPSISIFNEPCNFKPIRYYVLVENTNGYATNGGIHALNPNHQVELALRMDSVMVVQPKFDQFASPGQMGVLGVGRHRGETDNITCATRRLTDPVNGTLNACQKNIWYKFTTTVTGTIRYRVQYNTTNYWQNNHIQLFREKVPGDSTSTGLVFLPAANTVFSSGFNWSVRCISPGTYYILLPGCDAVNHQVFPEIEIAEQEGDFCNTPMVTQLNGAGTRVVPVLIDCHTIGTDYGEYNPTLTCPANAPTGNYKSTWFRLDIGGTDTLDVTVYIDEKTNALPTEIKYRMMTGNCNAMQEQSCVQDARTRNTYRCLAPGNSYFIQVLTPTNLPVWPYNLVTGTIDLHVEAVRNQAVCNPASNCIAVANFTPQFDCTVDRNARFFNFSTFGSDISYQWDFGYNGQTSTAVSPEFFYPALTRDSTYSVRLIVTNNACGLSDTAYRDIFIPARPAANLGPDTINCINGAQINFDVTSHPGSTYLWNTGRTLPTASFNTTGTYAVAVTYNNCVARDTVEVWINPIAPRAVQNANLCNNESITLNANRNRGEQYTWNTGATVNTITVSVPGVYWADLFLNGCVVRDSFRVFTNQERPLPQDTSLCSQGFPFIVNATLPGATSYRWQNNSTGPIFNITAPGIYWVDITLAGCTFRDTLVVAADTPRFDTITTAICIGTPFVLPSGRRIDASGIFRDTLQKANGCDSLITHLVLTVIQPQIDSATVSICQGASYQWRQGVLLSTPGVYRDTVRSILGCDSIIYQLTLQQQEAQLQNLNVSLCEGQFFLSPLGNTYTKAGIFRDTLRSGSGCDSIIYRIEIVVNEPVRQTNAATMCAGSNFTLPSGRVISAAGVYSDTLRAVAGTCDSLITTYTISVQSSRTETLAATICQGATYTLPSGRVISVAGQYRDTLRSNLGCDSVITVVQLTVTMPSVQNRTATICAGSSFTLPGGRTVSSAGTYRDTLRSTTGCDSIVFITQLGVQQPVAQVLTASICAGASYTLPSGRQVSSASTYRDTLRSARGCDSVRYTITLQVDAVQQLSQNISLCSGQSFTLPASGRSVSAAGIYRDTVRSISGCDSLITTYTISVQSSRTETLTATICQGATYTLPSGRVVSVAGQYRDTLRSVQGCDSVITVVQLTVTMPSVQNRTATICAGSSFTLPGGRTVSSAGTYRDTLRSTTGCDSIIFIVQLSVFTASNQVFTATTCSGSSYSLPSGRRVSSAGIYRDTLRNVQGCDSIRFTITLIVGAVAEEQRSGLICEGQPYQLPSGRRVTTAGVYRDTLRSAITGCDSVVVTTLRNYPPLQVSLSAPQAVCAGQLATFVATASGGRGTGYTYMWEGLATGNNSITLPITKDTVVRVMVADGCSVPNATASFSIRAVPFPQVTMPADTSVMFGAAITLRPTYSSGIVRYTWSPAVQLSCTNCPYPVATVRQQQTYTVRVENSLGCSASDTIQLDVLCRADNVFLPNTFTPNGDGNNDVWYPRGAGVRSVRFLRVFNRWGQMVFERTNFNTDDRTAGWDGTFKGVLLPPDVFVYSLGITCSNGQPIELKGNVMIVR
jgi:gliding motility-associated-like protein